jgi:plastocyanin
LVHVSSTGTLSYGSSAQGQTSGTLLWRIPHTSVGNYKYRCSAHPGAMIGEINVANTAGIYFAYST